MTLVGVSVTTGVKLLLTLGLVLVVLVVRRLVLVVARAVLRGRSGDPRRFWTRQGVQVVTARRAGDVVRLGFLETTIMEMGEPPAVCGADPAVWVAPIRTTPLGT